MGGGSIARRARERVFLANSAEGDGLYIDSLLVARSHRLADGMFSETLAENQTYGPFLPFRRCARRMGEYFWNSMGMWTELAIVVGLVFLMVLCVRRCRVVSSRESELQQMPRCSMRARPRARTPTTRQIPLLGPCPHHLTACFGRLRRRHARRAAWTASTICGVLPHTANGARFPSSYLSPPLGVIG